jgi:uncharacterized membrane protein
VNTYLAILFWFHLLGVTIWVGGSLLMPLAIVPSLQAIDPPARGKFMAAFSQRFALLAVISVVIVVLTGILQTGERFGGFGILTGINVLTIKVIVAVLMIANGAYVGFVLSRQSIALAPGPGQPPSPAFLKNQRLLGMHSIVQAVLSVIVLLLVGFLTA